MQTASIDLRTVQRWKAHEGLVSGDGRPKAVGPPTAAYALSPAQRVLREHGQTAHRGRAKAPRAIRPSNTHIATAPR